VYGGNEWNCGTWMDKMGSATSNRGVPSTSRHGANIEINALVYKVLRIIFQHKLSFDKELIELVIKWKENIEANFDQLFYLSKESYYKDTLDSDSSLRPNQLIAMAEAPELFNKDHAVNALYLILDKLLDIGVRTLSPDDPKYRSIYDNSLCVDDPSVDHGANYHNGPQWLWLLGPLYRSLKNFGHPKALFVKEHIRKVAELYENETVWGGLPELLNGDGSQNTWSYHIQTWSVAQFLQVLLDTEDVNGTLNDLKIS
jgi:glycogen debranching enzyme